MEHSWRKNIFTILLIFFLTSGASFNVTIVILHPKILDSASDNNFPEYVQFVEETHAILVLNKDFKNTTNWMFVIDMRGEPCHTEFPFNVIGYFTVNTEKCTSVDNTKHMNIRTYTFDYRRFVRTLILHTGEVDESVTVMYDETGQEYQEHHDLSIAGTMFFQIDISLRNCSVKHILKTVASKTEVKYIMLIASAKCVEEILHQARELDMVLGRYYWIVFTTDTRVPSCKDCEKYSVIYIRNNLAAVQESSYRPLVQRLVDFTKSVITETVHDDDKKSVCDCTNNCDPCFTAIRNTVSKLSGTKSGIYLQDNSSSYPLSFDIYRFVHNGGLQQVGHWDGETIEKNSSLYPDNATSVVLRVVSVVEPPFVFRNTTANTVSYYGYSIDAISAIAKRIGFKFTVKECDNKFYGNAGRDGRWTGCIGNMLRGEADIIVGALTVTAEREKVVDFTLPYYDFAGIQILMKKPNRGVSLFYFADVFTPIAWLCLGVVIVVTSMLLLLFDRFTPMSDENDQFEKNQSFDLKESIWYVVGSLTMSGGGEPPRSIPARILVAGFWFFSIVIMSTFTANLAAFLTVSRMGTSISSLGDLASQSDVRFSVVKETSIMSYFERMAAIEDNFYTIWKDMSLGVHGDARSLAVWDYPLGDKYVNIWKSINATGFLSTTEDAMERVAQGNFAYVTDSPVVKYLTSRDCDLTAVGDVFSIRPYAFALKNKSTWTKKISAAILELQKERVLEELKMKWWTEGSVQCGDSTSDKGLDLRSLAGSFIVVAVGISSGLLMLIIEFLWNSLRRRKPSSLLGNLAKKEETSENSKTDVISETSTEHISSYTINSKTQSQYTVYGDEVDTLY